MGLIFRAVELRRELDLFKQIAGRLIAPSSAYVLDEFGMALDQLLRRPGNLGRWEIPRARPVCTVCSGGDHEPDRRGNPGLYGQMSCVWEVTPSRSAKAKRGSADLVELTGIASIRMAILRAGAELTVWTIEVSSDGAPGVYFHSQIPGSGLPVPRLPAYGVTPLGGMEFLLSELFRSRWPESLASNAALANNWMGIQTERFDRTTSWLKSVVAGGGSPIVALQGAVPDAEIYL